MESVWPVATVPRAQLRDSVRRPGRHDNGSCAGTNPSLERACAAQMPLSVLPREADVRCGEDPRQPRKGADICRRHRRWCSATGRARADRRSAVRKP
jgi:hypothetical protein